VNQYLITAVEDGVGILQLNHPEKRNALGWELHHDRRGERRLRVDAGQIRHERLLPRPAPQDEHPAGPPDVRATTWTQPDGWTAESFGDTLTADVMQYPHPDRGGAGILG
jgi:hypothetical protein